MHFHFCDHAATRDAYIHSAHLMPIDLGSTREIQRSRRAHTSASACNTFKFPFNSTARIQLFAFGREMNYCPHCAGGGEGNKFRGARFPCALHNAITHMQKNRGLILIALFLPSRRPANPFNWFRTLRRGKKRAQIYFSCVQLHMCW